MLAAHAHVEVLGLLAGLAEARSQTDTLFDIIRPAALYQRPIPERHRIIFYIGHLEAFDWNLLRPYIPGLRSFHPQFDQLFAFGIDPVDGCLPSDQPRDWPSLADVHGYVGRVREALDFARVTSRVWDSPATLINVAIEHRLMHAETLAYMFHQMPLVDKTPQANTPLPAHGPVKARMIGIPSGAATLGLSREKAAAFGWDNEYDAQRV